MTTSSQEPTSTGRTLAGHDAFVTVDLAVGVAARVWRLAAGTAHTVSPVLRPVGVVAQRTPGLPERLRPRRWLAALEHDGAGRRVSVQERLSHELDVLVPAILITVLRRAHLTEVILQYVDLDRLVAAADLDAAARRIDVDAVAARIDLDQVVGRVDVNAVARRLDLDSVLDRLDLTAVVLRRVDLEAVVEAILARVDLVALAEEIIDAVDLPEIIRESTGAMASETVRGARMQGISADEAVGRAMDRLLLRRGPRSVRGPGGSGGEP